MGSLKSSPDESLFLAPGGCLGRIIYCEIIGYETNTHASLLYFERSYWHGLAIGMENRFDLLNIHHQRMELRYGHEEREMREMRDPVV
jgi:hypothetical protein